MSTRTIRRFEGQDGPLEIDEAARTVTKTYSRLAHDEAVRQVQRELACAPRLRAAFAGVAGLDCPRVLDWSFAAPVLLVRELCPGEPLSALLRQADCGARSKEIANRIAAGLELYTGEFAEPYYDCSFQNILFDSASGTVTFLDFGIPGRDEAADTDSPLDRSVGALVGWACYDMVRPARLLARVGGYMMVLRAVVRALEGRISRAAVEHHALRAYQRLSAAGSPARRRYYAGVGRRIVERRLAGLR